LQLVRPDQFLPIFLDHIFTFERHGLCPHIPPAVWGKVRRRRTRSRVRPKNN
jgi:hypothetical protein